MTLAVVLAGVAAWGWFGVVKDQVLPRNFGTVEAGHVYRSARLTPAALKKVHDRDGIRTVIDLGSCEPGTADEAVQARTAAALGEDRYILRLEGDGTGNPNAYVAALRLLADEKNHPVLVHCATGAQRTGGLVMLYRNLLQGRSIESVYPESFRYRHDPRDNPKLMSYLADYRGKIETAFRDGGWVEGFPPVETAPARADAGTPYTIDAAGR